MNGAGSAGALPAPLFLEILDCQIRRILFQILEMFSTMKFLRRSMVLIAGISFLVVVGCGGTSDGPKLPEGPKGVVKAKVSCNGKPVTMGILLLDSGKGFAAAAPAGLDGTFELKGPEGAEIPAGTYKVAITPPNVPSPPPGATEMPPAASIEGVPSKFYGIETSGVKVEIKAGNQEIEIVLQ